MFNENIAKVEILIEKNAGIGNAKEKHLLLG